MDPFDREPQPRPLQGSEPAPWQSCLLRGGYFPLAHFCGRVVRTNANMHWFKMPYEPSNRGTTNNHYRHAHEQALHSQPVSPLGVDEPQSDGDSLEPAIGQQSNPQTGYFESLIPGSTKSLR